MTGLVGISCNQIAEITAQNSDSVASNRDVHCVPVEKLVHRNNHRRIFRVIYIRNENLSDGLRPR